MWQQILGVVIGPIIEKLIKPFFIFIGTSIARGIARIRDEIQYRKELKEKKQRVKDYENARGKDDSRDTFNNLP